LTYNWTATMLISTPMDLKQPRQMSFGTETHHFQPFPNSDHDPLSFLYVTKALKPIPIDSAYPI